MSTGFCSNKSKFLLILLLPFAREIRGQVNGPTKRQMPDQTQGQAESQAQESTRPSQLRRFPQDTPCIASILNCGVPQEGMLAPGDCLDTLDRHYDDWQFFGIAGDEVTILLEPLDPALTYPTIDLEPPAGQTSHTPFVLGDIHKPATMKYVLPTTGMWTISVGSGSAGPGSGSYRLQTFCSRSPLVGVEDCVPQPASCNQSWFWSTTPRSCSFSNLHGAAYAQFDLYLDKGDSLRLDLLSNDVDPALALYHKNGHDAITAAFGEIDGVAFLTYKVSTSGLYTIAAYDANVSDYARFNLDIYCDSTCTPPAIAIQPSSQTLQSGPLTLSVTTLGEAPFTYQWYQGASSDTHHPVSSEATLQLASVPASASYWVRVTNACGSADSSAARINVVAPGQHHAVRH